MLVFGIDIPLIEILLIFSIIIFILFVEAIIVIALLMSQLNKMKGLASLLDRLSGTILDVKKAELDEIEKLKRR
ncbi:hypothetical protein HYV86_01980 [Candidatus Woesearchaeota archaeon]|nr:hypothetical protein [Candidatus Woesearchaeota archaeon]